MKITLCLLAIFTAIGSFAGNTATIEQMKNKKAIIRFDDDIPFRLGQKVIVTSNEDSDYTFGKASRNLLEKKNSITFSSGITNLTTKTDSGGTVRTSSFDISVRYGINKVDYEYGPIFNFENNKLSSGTTTSYNIGGFYEHNFVPNNAQEDKIHGLFGDITIGSMKTSSDTVSPLTFNIGAFYKWFALSPVLAFRFDAAYRYSKYDDTTINGFVLSGGINHYF